ncbi:D-lactaldehyde dehydrogenase [Guyanagaster necrorhizus]|uniref:D-lactaldehyde dehydrogenase n=1 Tax=Guyanagaster necrorhizus TaxID=856835 RepID=A0A9P7VMJ7_9AGAR|nr:D-lactaldehyde dehydrogenase [Guyanagaster necrorhizus MCA 3950]KAG7443070.1 D-lactaldehyde dehydrogenase [Guyanagaster necrorhizus MCA 3950]
MPAVTDTNSTILVTGANGFIGTWIVGHLLKGGYSVRAAVRNEGRGKHLLDIYESYGARLKLFAVGDISKRGAFDDAVKGVDAIIHTASPVHLSADEPSELIDPAVGGVKGILKSALKNGSDSLKRIVMSSSSAAIVAFSTAPVTVSEADWNEPPIKECEEKGRDASSLAKYSASKTLAEKAAWAFYEKHKPEIKWDISVINPPWVIGPAIHEVTTVDSLNASSKHWYDAIVREDFGGFSPLTTPGHGWADVRDVAMAHVRAMEVPSAGGERIIISVGSWVWQDWLDVISELSPNPYPSRTLPRGTPGICQRAITFDMSKEQRILGIKFRMMEETAKDVLADYEHRGW